MRGLVLAVILGTAFPAFGAEDSKPVKDSAPEMKATALDEVAPSEAAPAPEMVEKKPVEAAAHPPLPASAVARATFATAIDQREPVDEITSLASDQNRAYYFTELVGIGGRQVTHRWEHEGAVVAEVPIAIAGPRWRAYSSKGLDESQLGKWTVSVVDESGNVVRKDSLVYEKAAPAPEVAAPTATPPMQASPGQTPAKTAPTQTAPTQGGEAPDEAPASPAAAQP